MTRHDYSDEVRKHGSLAVRVLLVLAGTAFVALGIAGAFLPVLPTTPFLLLAAACYARASTRFYNGLLNSRMFGPTIREWQRYRSIRYRTKLTAIALMAVTLSISIAFFVTPPALQAALALLGLALAVYLYRIPSRDHPRRRAGS
ncbi:MAG TPA: YbaN family protein [Burkholderiales bacterium]|nr:YbaN family protein [Burkholderiales bacterium]